MICMGARRVVRREPLALLALLLSVAALWALSAAFDPRCQCTDDALTDDEARRCRCGPHTALPPGRPYTALPAFRADLQQTSCSCSGHCQRPLQIAASCPYISLQTSRA